MTILYLSNDPKQCVAAYSDKELDKTIKAARETLQVLLGRKSYAISKRPLTVWARKSAQNFGWLLAVFLEANLERVERLGHLYVGWTVEQEDERDASWKELVTRLSDYPPKTGDDLFTPPPIDGVFSGPIEEVLDEVTGMFIDNSAEAYWKYYLTGRKELRWTTRKIPYVIAEKLAEYKIVFVAKSFKRKGVEVNVCQCMTS